MRKLLNSNQKFDAVIMEQFSNDALKVLAYVYDCPLIILSSMGPNSWVNALIGNEAPVSYTAHLLTGDFSKDLLFVNKAKNYYYVFPKQEAVIRHAFPNAPSLFDLSTNVSLVLLNSHTSLYPALQLVPNMVEVGGYFIDPPKPLPTQLQERSQQDVLAHPNIKLFITHEGLLSTTETIYHGVPILALPVFGDQDASLEFNEANFENAIRELLTNTKYRENAQRRSKIYHDRSEHPMKTATYWVDYVIRHRGAPHLKVAGVRLV